VFNKIRAGAVIQSAANFVAACNKCAVKGMMTTEEAKKRQNNIDIAKLIKNSKTVKKFFQKSKY
jgi:hypothetical protein